MASFSYHIFHFFLFTMIAFAFAQEFDRSFDQNYYPYYGLNHFKHLQDGDDEIQLVLDQSTGAGFKSKQEFGSGRFHMNLKIPKERSKGVLPNFYLISNNPASEPHSELDFEFMGTDGTLQTNIFANDKGGRERRFQLWFDPSEDFHSYTILWNSHQIVFFVDDIPITVFKNMSDIGAQYPLAQPLHIEATIWDGSAWAGAVNWTAGPFTTYYRSFVISGCPADYSGSGKCESPEYEWNDPGQWVLSPEQEQLLEEYQKFRSYDYCVNGNATINYPECGV